MLGLLKTVVHSGTTQANNSKPFLKKADGTTPDFEEMPKVPILTLDFQPTMTVAQITRPLYLEREMFWVEGIHGAMALLDKRIWSDFYHLCRQLKPPMGVVPNLFALSKLLRLQKAKDSSSGAALAVYRNIESYTLHFKQLNHWQSQPSKFLEVRCSSIRSALKAETAYYNKSRWEPQLAAVDPCMGREHGKNGKALQETICICTQIAPAWGTVSLDKRHTWKAQLGWWGATWRHVCIHFYCTIFSHSHSS